jgi:hypothetical protein
MLRITFIRYAQSYSEHTRWRLFWAYLMKVILSIPDEGYSEHIWWKLFWAYQMKVILSISDEGYSEHTWWRLFWAYQMKVILSDGKYDWKKCTLVQATNERPLQTSCCSLEAAASCLLRVRCVTFIYISLKLASEKLGIICIPQGFFHGTHQQINNIT